MLFFDDLILIPIDYLLQVLLLFFVAALAALLLRLLGHGLSALFNRLFPPHR